MLTKKAFRYFFSALMLLGVAVVMFSPDIPGLRRINHYAVFILFAYLAFAMILLVFGRKYTMVTALACAGALSLYLKTATNSKLKYAVEKNSQVVSIAHYNTSSFNDGFSAASRSILNEQADIVSIQELTPDWEQQMSRSLSEQFPYKMQVVRIDPLGTALYSKYPILSMDTLYHNSLPFLHATIGLENNRYIDLIAVHLLPPLDQSSYDNLSAQLQTVVRTTHENINPKIIVGNFNISPWSKEIVQFKYQGELDDSRRGIAPASLGGNFSPFRIPVNHIFHTLDLSCTDFKPLYDGQGEEIGILGQYQFNQSRF